MSSWKMHVQAGFCQICSFITVYILLQICAIFAHDIDDRIDYQQDNLPKTQQVYIDWMTKPFASLKVYQAADQVTCKDLLGKQGDDVFTVLWSGTDDGWYDIRDEKAYRGWLDGKQDGRNRNRIDPIEGVEQTIVVDGR